MKVLSSVPRHTDVQDPFYFKGFWLHPELVDRIKAKFVRPHGCRVCSIQAQLKKARHTVPVQDVLENSISIPVANFLVTLVVAEHHSGVSVPSFSHPA